MNQYQIGSRKLRNRNRWHRIKNIELFGSFDGLLYLCKVKSIWKSDGGTTVEICFLIEVFEISQTSLAALSGEEPVLGIAFK